MNRTTRFFQTLTVSSFSMAFFNTYSSMKIRAIKAQLEREVIKNEELQTKLDSLKNVNKDLSESNSKCETLVENIQNLINTKGGNSGSKSQFIEPLQEFFNNLSFEETLNILHLSGSAFILITVFSILCIIYADKLIIYLNIEGKYPKLARLIQLRRKFQQYYLMLNIFLIAMVSLGIFYINLLILLGY